MSDPSPPALVPNLPHSGWQRFFTLFKRALLLQCPYCGSPGIFRLPFWLKESCPGCETTFIREDGYFLGAYAINLVVAEVLGLGVILVILFRSDLDLLWQEVIAISAALILPVVFFPFSRTFWMAIDLMFDRSPDETRLRGGEFN